MEKTQNILQHIAYLYKYTYLAHSFDFLPYQFYQNYEFIVHGFSFVRVLVLILTRAILDQQMNNKLVSKIYGGMFTTYIHSH